MRRRCVFAIALVLTAGSAALADSSLPLQPPPVANPLGTGDEKERAACAPDVVKYCKELIKDDNNSDVFAILNCLQTHRSRISKPCGQVLASHGQ